MKINTAHTEKIKKYRVEYGKLKLHYAAESLAKHAREYGYYDELDDDDYLSIAVSLFANTHFLGDVKCESYDADTRGCEWQEWMYRLYGAFQAWIHATTVYVEK